MACSGEVTPCGLQYFVKHKCIAFLSEMSVLFLSTSVLGNISKDKGGFIMPSSGGGGVEMEMPFQCLLVPIPCTQCMEAFAYTCRLLFTLALVKTSWICYNMRCELCHDECLYHHVKHIFGVCKQDSRAILFKVKFMVVNSLVLVCIIVPIYRSAIGMICIELYRVYRHMIYHIICIDSDRYISSIK